MGTAKTAIRGEVVVTDQDGARPPPAGVPAQMPPLSSSFVSRENELTTLDEWLSERGAGTRLVVLSGLAGVGKTALATRWLQGLRNDYPGGLLFVDLAGGTSDPVTPSDALEWFLLSLGTDPKDIPLVASQRSAMYRTATAGRRLLVFLDNAVSAAQVRPLLPSSGESVVVVTSRFRLSSLAIDGARWVEVGPLDVGGAVRMLTRILGERRAQEEPAAVRELARLSGGLPLALAITAARLATRPRRRLADEVVNLANEHRRFVGLAVDDVSVAAVFDLAYAGLPADAVRLHRLCAWHPGPDFDTEMAAATLAWDLDRADTALDVLLESSFLVEYDEHRFGYHDLLRLYARTRSEHEDSPEDRSVAVKRMVQWYLDRTIGADLVVHPLRPRLSGRYDEVRQSASPYADAPEALAWLEAHRLHLSATVDIAAERQWHEFVWQMCEALWGFFLHTRHYSDWIRLHKLGIAATQRCGDRRAEARLRSQLGFAYAKLHEYDDAAAENTVALRLAQQEQDDQAGATALSQLGRVARERGRLEEALDYYRQASAIQGRIGEWRGVALCRRRIGQVLSTLGRHDEAGVELSAAAETMRELGDTTQYTRTLLFLAESRMRTGQLDDASSLLRNALSLMRSLGSPYYQAEVLAKLGEVAVRQDDRDSARASYAEAAELYAAVGDPTAEVIRRRLADL